MYYLSALRWRLLLKPQLSIIFLKDGRIHQLAWKLAVILVFGRLAIRPYQLHTIILLELLEEVDLVCQRCCSTFSTEVSRDTLNRKFLSELDVCGVWRDRRRIKHLQLGHSLLHVGGTLLTAQVENICSQFENFARVIIRDMIVLVWKVLLYLVRHHNHHLSFIFSILASNCRLKQVLSLKWTDQVVLRARFVLFACQGVLVGTNLQLVNTTYICKIWCCVQSFVLRDSLHVLIRAGCNLVILLID